MTEQRETGFDFEETLVTSTKRLPRRSLWFVVILGVLLTISAAVVTTATKYWTHPEDHSMGTDVYVRWVVTLSSGKYYEVIREAGATHTREVAWMKYLDHKHAVVATNDIRKSGLSVNGNQLILKYLEAGQRVERVRLLNRIVLSSKPGSWVICDPNLLTDEKIIEEISKHFSPDDLEPDLYF